MLSNFIIALEAVLPIFMIMGIGMLIRRKGLVDAHDVKKMNQTVFMVFFPVLMFSNLYGKDIRGSIEGKLMTFGVLAVLSVYALTVAVVMKLRKDPKTRGAMIQAIFRSNFVIMGIPIVSNIFGGDELILPSVMITVIVPIYNVLAVVTLEVFRGQQAEFRACAEADRFESDAFGGSGGYFRGADRSASAAGPRRHGFLDGRRRDADVAFDAGRVLRFSEHREPQKGHRDLCHRQIGGGSGNRADGWHPARLPRYRAGYADCHLCFSVCSFLVSDGAADGQ